MKCLCDWWALTVFTVLAVIAVYCVWLGGVWLGDADSSSAGQINPPAALVPVASPGPIEVELEHTSGKFTFRLGGTGYPVVIDPGSGRRYILLPTKDR